VTRRRTCRDGHISRVEGCPYCAEIAPLVPGTAGYADQQAAESRRIGRQRRARQVALCERIYGAGARLDARNVIGAEERRMDIVVVRHGEVLDVLATDCLDYERGADEAVAVLEARVVDGKRAAS
jgi:hypothetical protein